MPCPQRSNTQNGVLICPCYSVEVTMVKKGSKPLTALEIKFLEIKDKRYEVSDVPGLFLRVNTNGSKVWRIDKSIKGKRIKKTLGYYPEISIMKARQELDKLVNAKLNNLPENTFGAIFFEWIALKKESISEAYYKDILSKFRRFILPTLGELDWGEITPTMVLNLLRKEEVKVTVARHLAATIKEIEAYVVNYGRASSTKFQTIQSALPTHKVKHYAYVHYSVLDLALKPVVKNILTASRTEQNRLLYFKLLQAAFYTLSRPMEITSLEWDWIDFSKKVITFPPEIMKKEREHLVPITPQLERVLKSIEPTGQYVFILPTVTSKLRSVKIALTNKLSLKDLPEDYPYRFTMHGIRAIGRTWMSEHGVEMEVAEHTLAHAYGDATVQAYNRTTLLNKRVGVMTNWCNFVEEVFKKVIPEEYLF